MIDSFGTDTNGKQLCAAWSILIDTNCKREMHMDNVCVYPIKSRCKHSTSFCTETSESKVCIWDSPPSPTLLQHKNYASKIPKSVNYKTKEKRKLRNEQFLETIPLQELLLSWHLSLLLILLWLQLLDLHPHQFHPS